MNNLKFVAIGLFVIFAGLFIFSKVRKDPTRDVASIDSSSKAPRVHKKMSKTVKVVPPSEVNMALTTSTVEEIPEPKVQKEGEFYRHKGRLVARLMNGKLLPPYKGSTKKLLFSKKPDHPEMEMKAKKFFKAMGFNSDKKMKVERGEAYYLVMGDDAIKVDAFKVSYNWNGNPKTKTFLMKSDSGRLYRKLADSK